MTNKRLEFIKAIGDFKDKKIAVFGDLMLDHFIAGNAERISPEAPVPVVVVEREFFAPGGAGNVAANIAALGGKAILFGAAGLNEAARQLFKEFKKWGINDKYVIKCAAPTIQKIRIIAGGQQIARIDREKTCSPNKSKMAKIFKFLPTIIRETDGVVFSDYAKGFVTKELARSVIKLAKKHRKFVVADARPQRAFHFKNATVLTPNHKEAAAIAKHDDIKEAGQFIMKRLNTNVLITRGADGMLLFEKSGIKNFKAEAKEVFDVVGAGDTVVAVLALGLATGLNLKDSALLSNLAAGIAVGKRGTATVSPEELKNAIIT